MGYTCRNLQGMYGVLKQCWECHPNCSQHSPPPARSGNNKTAEGLRNARKLVSLVSRRNRSWMYDKELLWVSIFGSNNSDPDFDANKDQISAPVLTPDPWCCTPAIAMIPKLPFFHGSDKYA